MNHPSPEVNTAPATDATPTVAQPVAQPVAAADKRTASASAGPLSTMLVLGGAAAVAAGVGATGLYYYDVFKAKKPAPSVATQAPALSRTA